MSYVILWGGTDINPEIYNQAPLKSTQVANRERDEYELNAIKKAIENKVPVIGVCRGAQLLCAYMGGSLYQHVKRGDRYTTPVTDEKTGQSFYACLDHHQVMIPKGGVNITTQYLHKPVQAYVDDLNYVEIDKIPMIHYWPETKLLAIQPHPEWMNKNTSFVGYVNDLCKTLFKEINANVF